MTVLNLTRKFKAMKMLESENFKEYSGQPLKVSNQVRLFGAELPDSGIVQKLLVTVFERFEATISA